MKVGGWQGLEDGEVLGNAWRCYRDLNRGTA